MRIVFWLNTPSPHVAPIAKELAASGVHDVHVITEWALSPTRRRLGWEQPDHGRASVTIAPDDRKRRQLERDLADGSCHVFSGLGVYPKTTHSLRQVAGRSPRHIALMTEPWRPGGFRGLARTVKYWQSARGIRPLVHSYLSIGKLAERQLSFIGVKQERIFPFAYCVGSGSHDLVDSGARNEYTIGFVGKLEPRKNVGLLLRAVKELDAGWRLIIVGSGPDDEKLAALASRLGIEKHVEFMGTQPNSTVAELMSVFDLLVLPSLFDGWGAVVNEAMLAGVPVVVSDAVGAANIIGTTEQGRTFPNNDSRALRDAISDFMMNGPVEYSRRVSLARRAQATISPTVIAGYLAKILDRKVDDHPTPPWL